MSPRNLPSDTQRVSRGIRMFNLEGREVGWSKLHPNRFTSRQRDPVPITPAVGRVPGSCLDGNVKYISQRLSNLEIYIL
jgi:hypothetical protein